MNELEMFQDMMELQFELIKKIKSEDQENVYKTILCYNLIDLVSKSVYGNLNLKHREKFIKFIEEYCQWEYANYVSLPQLKLALELDARTDFDRVREFVDDKVNSFPSGVAVTIDYDVNINDIAIIWPRNLKIQNKYSIESFVHKNLLYNMRNSLTHEMRMPAHSSKLFSEVRPHYVKVIKSMYLPSKSKKSDKVFSLVYPVEFFYSILDDSIKRLKDFYEKKGINPYSYFNSTDLWIEK